MRTILLPLIFTLLVGSCHAGWNPFKKKYRRSGEENARQLVEEMQAFDPKLRDLFERASAFAVFPRISKLALGVGGSGGNGKVFKDGKLVGTCKLSQLSVGFQIGGQVFSQVILFQDDETFREFRMGKFSFGGSVSVALLDDGFGGEVGFKDGTAIIIKGHKGLMYEAAVKGQRFRFKPLYGAYSNPFEPHKNKNKLPF